MDSTAHLYAALAAILNALEATGEAPIPVTTRGHSAINGANGWVEADRQAGQWVARMQER